MIFSKEVCLFCDSILKKEAYYAKCMALNCKYNYKFYFERFAKGNVETVEFKIRDNWYIDIEIPNENIKNYEIFFTTPTNIDSIHFIMTNLDFFNKDNMLEKFNKKLDLIVFL